MRTLVVILLLLSENATSAPPPPPEISRGVRILVGDFVDLEKKENRTFFVPQQLEVLDVRDTNASLGGSTLSTPEDVISLFAKLPATTQKNGLWLTYTLGSHNSFTEHEKITKLTAKARERNILMFACTPEKSSTQKAQSVAWRCEKKSPRTDISPVICQPRAELSPSKAPQWTCAWLH